MHFITKEKEIFCAEFVERGKFPKNRERESGLSKKKQKRLSALSGKKGKN